MDAIITVLLVMLGALGVSFFLGQRSYIRLLEEHCKGLDYAADQLQIITDAQVIVDGIITGAKSLPFPGMRKRDAQRHRKTAPGHVYLMCINNEYHKIGFAGDVRSRLSGIQMSSPYKVEVLHVIVAHHAPRLEVLLQNRYAEKWISGEWFKLSLEDVETICSIASPITVMDIDRMESQA